MKQPTPEEINAILLANHSDHDPAQMTGCNACFDLGLLALRPWVEYLEGVTTAAYAVWKRSNEPPEISTTHLLRPIVEAFLADETPMDLSGLPDQ